MEVNCIFQYLSVLGSNNGAATAVNTGSDHNTDTITGVSAGASTTAGVMLRLMLRLPYNANTNAMCTCLRSLGPSSCTFEPPSAPRFTSKMKCAQIWDGQTACFEPLSAPRFRTCSCTSRATRATSCRPSGPPAICYTTILCYFLYPIL